MIKLSLSSFLSNTILIAVSVAIGFNATSQTNSKDFSEAMDSLFFKEDGSKRPGYSIAVVENDSVIYQHSLGQINVEKQLPFTENSVFAIASCTKQFTAFGVLLLEQEGKLKLEDDIRKHIPELPDFGAIVTVRHLLSHTSGIRDHLTLLDWENKQWAKDYTFKGTIRGLHNYPGLCFQPGENFAYSNTGYVLLAILIERASGVAIDTFMHERIFKPLEMNNTDFCYKRDYRAIGFSRPYNYDWNKKKFLTYRLKEVNAMGAVGIYTTINDFIKWDRNFSTKTVGNEALFERLLQSDTLNNGLEINYNNGLKERFVKGYHVIEHSGGWAFYNFQYTRIPELNLSVIIASNNELDYPIGMAETYINSILPNDRIPANPSADVSQKTEWTQYYLSNNFTLRALEFDSTGRSLSIKDTRRSKRYPIYADRNGNLMDSTGNEFVLNDDREEFRWSGGGYFNIPTVFRTIFRPPANIDELIGEFVNAELGTIRIRYNQKKKEFKIKTSFGKNPIIKEMKGAFLDLDKVAYDLLAIDDDTLVIGNSIVFNLVFTRK